MTRAGRKTPKAKTNVEAMAGASRKPARTAANGTSFERRVAQARKAVAEITPARAGAALRDTWSQALTALTAAEDSLEKQVRSLLKKNRISTRDASSMLDDVSALVRRERRKAVKELDARMKTLQARIVKERRVVGRMVNDGVQNALAAFNIPSRHEVAELVRKVDQLSAKIDSLRRR
jgi:polyhydroxyalkanoate synthesis regulator phasin